MVMREADEVNIKIFVFSSKFSLSWKFRWTKWFPGTKLETFFFPFMFFHTKQSFQILSCTSEQRKEFQALSM